MASNSSTDNYRARIYAQYVTARVGVAVPESAAALARHAHYFRRAVRQHVPNDHDIRVLDLGCGYGIFIHALREAGYHNVREVEGSHEQVQAAKRLGIHGVEHGDLYSTLEETPPESVDLVICFDVIEHFTKCDLVDLVDLVDAVHRILKPNGRWLIDAPNAESPFWGRVRYGDYTHEQAFIREPLAQLLLSSGFTAVRCFEDRPVVRGVKSAVRAVLWRYLRVMLLIYIAIECGSLSSQALFSQNLLAVAIRK